MIRGKNIRRVSRFQISGPARQGPWWDALYGVETKNLNKAVRRNVDRFPTDFMFQLTLEEAQACSGSRFQIGTLKKGHNIKYLPYAFTQEGVAMLSSVLRSERGSGEHRHYAGFCAAPGHAGVAQGIGA